MAKKTREDVVEEMCDKLINDLKDIREKKNITTAKLAELTEIAQPNITRMETGRAKPNLKTIMAIAHALGAKVELRVKV